jgi:hypothetical protein
VKCARPERPFRAAGAALALLTFASPLLGSFHEAAVRHSTCPEDGALIESPAQPAHPHAEASGDGPSLFPERDPAGPPGGEGAHHHCAVAAQVQLRAREPSRQRFAVPAPVLLAAASVAQEPPVLRSFAIYRIAPKASPPG